MKRYGGVMGAFDVGKFNVSRDRGVFFDDEDFVRKLVLGLVYEAH